MLPHVRQQRGRRGGRAGCLSCALARDRPLPTGVIAFDVDLPSGDERLHRHAAAAKKTERQRLARRRGASPQPQETVEHREAQKLLQEGLSALPEEYRKVLILREIEGLSYTEIAESASIELGTVKSRISRGRSLLRNFLSGNGNFFEITSSKVTECNREEMSAK